MAGQRLWGLAYDYGGKFLVSFLRLTAWNRMVPKSYSVGSIINPMIITGLRILYNVHVAIEKASSLFNILFGTALPFVIIFGCNLLIIIAVKRAGRERDKLKSSQVEKQQKDSVNT
jgi:hypothetical protein